MFDSNAEALSEVYERESRRYPKNLEDESEENL